MVVVPAAAPPPIAGVRLIIPQACPDCGAKFDGVHLAGEGQMQADAVIVPQITLVCGNGHAHTTVLHIDHPHGIIKRVNLAMSVLGGN